MWLAPKETLLALLNKTKFSNNDSNNDLKSNDSYNSKNDKYKSSDNSGNINDRRYDY